MYSVNVGELIWAGASRYMQPRSTAGEIEGFHADQDMDIGMLVIQPAFFCKVTTYIVRSIWSFKRNSTSRSGLEKSGLDHVFALPVSYCRCQFNVCLVSCQ